MAPSIVTYPTTSTSASNPVTTTQKMPQTSAQIARNIVDLLLARGESDYIGEPISQLAHSLQAAHFASISGEADDLTIVAALLHDIGQFLPASEAIRIAGQAAAQDMKDGAKAQSKVGPDSGSVGRAGHEMIGQTYLAELGFHPKVCSLVGAHVTAKRYLCATEEGYYEALSDASKRSLKMQGGPFTAQEIDNVKREMGEDWCKEMCRLRKWDDSSKVVGLEVKGAAAYEAMIEKCIVGAA